MWFHTSKQTRGCFITQYIVVSQYG
ncbi:hypothetical protein MED222_06450 [Vibrio sp. MED222]|nr:hypothetical protein MED222_06450 [Vibrio sp. MED222]